MGWSITMLSQNIVQGEYFIDTDLGFGNNTLVNFTPVADGTFPLSIDLTGLQPGSVSIKYSPPVIVVLETNWYFLI